MFDCDAVVVGAGIVGLAIARALAMSGREVVIVEAASAIGTETSSRNSEVIHAGIYYPTDSLKAKLCVEGRRALYAYCSVRGIPHRPCGKLIVAADAAEVGYLERITRQARDNGVDDLMLLGSTGLRAREPALAGEAAILSPSTGIIDSHALMLSYLDEAESAGAMLALSTPMIRGEVGGSGILLDLGGTEPTRLQTRTLVNAAGLSAWLVSGRIEGVDRAAVPPRHLCKGSYFGLATRAPFTHLIYPVPSQAGLGTHLTLDMAGRARFGPDVEWVQAVDYAVEPARADQFYDAIRRYWPDLPDGALQPDYAGIRPKVVGPGQAGGDFVIQGPHVTGADGYVALYGIESPGLTASLTIADRVLSLVER